MNLINITKNIVSFFKKNIDKFYDYIDSIDPNKQKLKVENLIINKRDAYIEISFSFSIHDIQLLHPYLYQLLKNIFSEYKSYFNEEKEKVGDDYEIQITSMMNFSSRLGYRGTVAHLGTISIKSIEDDKSITEFIQLVENNIIIAVEKYRIEYIESLTFKII